MDKKMDNFLRMLNSVSISNNEDLGEAFKAGLLLLRGTKEVDRLGYALRLLEWTKNYPLLIMFSEEIINDVLELAKKTATEEAVLLLNFKAGFDAVNSDVHEAIDFSDLALKKSRDIGSNNAEVNSLIIKGSLCDAKKEHKKASAWYNMALAKCTELQRPVLMLNMGISFSKQGEYSQAWSFIDQAKSLASDLSDDMSLKDTERAKLNRFVIRAYLQLGQVHEGLGDFDGAFRAYDKGLSLSMQYKFTKETYQIYFHKAQAHFMIGSDSEAEATMEKARELRNESWVIDPSILYDEIFYWVRELKNTKQYEVALEMYKHILFEDAVDAQTGFKRLNDLMDNLTNTFLEIVTGIEVCLHATGRITESEILSKEEALFSELAKQTGIGIENDRNYKLQIQKNSLGAALRMVFFKEIDFVAYKNIKAQYDPKEDKATFKIGEKEIKKARRYFLVFKCLADNAGKHVSGEMLDKFVLDQGEAIDIGNSGLRTYVNRLKKEINLAQFLEPYSRSSKGWKLKAP